MENELILNVIRDREPEMLSPGEILGQLLDAHPAVTKADVETELARLEAQGLVVKRFGTGEGVTLWTIK